MVPIDADREPEPQAWLNEAEEDRLAEARRRKRQSILARLPPAPPAALVVPPILSLNANPTAAPPASSTAALPAAMQAPAPAVPTVPAVSSVPTAPVSSTMLRPPTAGIPTTVKRPRDESHHALAAAPAHRTTARPLATPPASKAQPESPGEASGDESDDEDMFAVRSSSSESASADQTAPEQRPSVATTTKAGSGRRGRAVAADSADDPEGYYPLTLGEALDGGRYVVEANLGKGMFSSVVRAHVQDGHGAEAEGASMVAIKIVRSQESMYKAGLREAGVLERIQAADPDDKGHVVRMYRHFVHRGHLCLVFESLSMNLRQVVRRFGQGVGLHIGGVRSYAHQSLLALSLLSRAGIVHADLKPDNILVSESKALLKVCDLGSAGDAPADPATGVPPGGKRVMEIAPYLVSRFYRAPEIILGSGPPGPEIDMWSLGCTLFELYTAHILFPGRSNNHMLYLFQKLRGRFPTRMARRGHFARTHFDDLGNFLLRDAGSAKPIAFTTRPDEDIRSRLGLANKRTQGAAPGTKPTAGTAAGPGHAATTSSSSSTAPPPPSTSGERLLVERLANLLERMLELDPAKRITPKEALAHPFFAAHQQPAAST